MCDKMCSSPVLCSGLYPFSVLPWPCGNDGQVHQARAPGRTLGPVYHRYVSRTRTHTHTPATHTVSISRSVQLFLCSPTCSSSPTVLWRLVLRSHCLPGAPLLLLLVAFVCEASQNLRRRRTSHAFRNRHNRGTPDHSWELSRLETTH